MMSILQSKHGWFFFYRNHLIIVEFTGKKDNYIYIPSGNLLHSY